MTILNASLYFIHAFKQYWKGTKEEQLDVFEQFTKKYVQILILQLQQHENLDLLKNN